MKKSITKKNTVWKELKKLKRKDFNSKYTTSNITLDRCIKYIESGYGNTEVIFTDDASEEEINKVVQTVESLL